MWHALPLRVDEGALCVAGGARGGLDTGWQKLEGTPLLPADDGSDSFDFSAASDVKADVGFLHLYTPVTASAMAERRHFEKAAAAAPAHGRAPVRASHGIGAHGGGARSGFARNLHHDGSQKLWFRQSYPEFAIQAGEHHLTSLTKDQHERHWTAHVAPMAPLTLDSSHLSRPSLPKFPMRGIGRWSRAPPSDDNGAVAARRRPPPTEAWAEDQDARGWASAALPSQPGALAASLIGSSSEPPPQRPAPQPAVAPRHRQAPTLHGGAPRSALATQKRWEAHVYGTLRQHCGNILHEQPSGQRGGRRRIEEPGRPAAPTGAPAMYNVARFRECAGWG